MRKYTKKSTEEELEMERKEQKERGERIKYIRENELKLNKTELGKKIGVSSQFLGLVEEGKGNLVYRSIKKLKLLSGHSADYILYGVDDEVIDETREFMNQYSDKEIIQAMKAIKEIALFMKKDA